MSVTTENRKPSGRPTRIAVIACALLLAVSLPVLTQTVLADLPPRPSPQPSIPTQPTDLPPRPLPQPSIPTQPADLPPRPLPQPSIPTRSEAEPAFAGARVELYVQFSLTRQWAKAHWQELWTVLQWQDAQGCWHNVEGWQGTLDELQDGEGRKTWWVAKADLGKGPFRWVVYQGRDGDLLGISRLFDLPHSAGETVRIQVSLAL